MADNGSTGVDDSSSNNATDPTKNVLALNEAASKRQDDLRDAGNNLVDEKIRCVKEIVDLRATHRIEVDVLRDGYEGALRIAESKRIDAIRAVDVNAVSIASQRSADQAQVLATQVVQSAEALRALVATTAATVVQSQQQLAAALSERITKLEQAQYEGVGKQRVADPMLAEMVTELRALRTATTLGSGKAAGSTDTRNYGVAAMGVLFGLLSMIGGLIAFFWTK